MIGNLQAVISKCGQLWAVLGNCGHLWAWFFLFKSIRHYKNATKSEGKLFL